MQSYSMVCGKQKEKFKKQSLGIQPNVPGNESI